jgi:hypothetical protein
MIAHSLAWTFYASVVLAVARSAARDWRDPEEDRRIVLIAAGAFAALLAAVGVMIATV